MLGRFPRARSVMCLETFPGAMPNDMYSVDDFPRPRRDVFVDVFPRVRCEVFREVLRARGARHRDAIVILAP